MKIFSHASAKKKTKGLKGFEFCTFNGDMMALKGLNYIRGRTYQGQQKTDKIEKCTAMSKQAIQFQYQYDAVPRATSQVSSTSKLCMHCGQVEPNIINIRTLYALWSGGAKYHQHQNSVCTVVKWSQISSISELCMHCGQVEPNIINIKTLYALWSGGAKYHQHQNPVCTVVKWSQISSASKLCMHRGQVEPNIVNIKTLYGLWSSGAKYHQHQNYVRTVVKWSQISLTSNLLLTVVK